jgi:replication factor C subunit 3/5
MSDYEDDMDVDIAPVKNKEIQFSADGNAGKQKRIVADLPVEAEDNLPWWAYLCFESILI